MGKIGIFFYRLIFIIYILGYALLSILTVWSSKLWKYLFNIWFISLILFSIYLILYSLLAFKIKLLFIFNHYKWFKYTYILFKDSDDILLFLLNCQNLIDKLNEINYGKYIDNCPFTFNSDLILFNESIYEKRRCELYNINLNSRYKYQYICSYNASENFENDKTKDGFEQIICIPKINNIYDNKIIAKFNNIYENKEKNESNLFYCSRIDKPKKNEYIEEKYCNMKSKFPTMKIVLSFLLIFLYFLHHILFKILSEDLSIKFNNMLEVLREYINRVLDKDDNDTEYDESNSNNVSFNEEEDQNIILENHIVYSIDINIKDYYIENKEKLKHN